MVRAKFKKRMQARGSFTIIEIVMVIVIIGVIAALGVPIAAHIPDMFSYGIYRKEISEQADIVLRRLTREIRRLRDANSVITAESGRYRFIDSDGRGIEFRLSGVLLQRECDGQQDALAADVQALSFVYRNRQMAVIPSPLVSPNATDIRFIEINVTFNAGNTPISYRALARLRNVGR